MALFLLAALALTPAFASNPFNSDVVALNPKSWKELENSPHAWVVT
jgi:hypothetical protein